MKIWFKYLWIFCFVCFSLLLKSQVRVEQSVMSEFTKQNVVPVFLYLKEQANLSAVHDQWTKERKGEYVYHQLKMTAENAQENLIQFLKKEKIPFRSFFIANAIHAEINLSQLNQLRSRKEIRSILYDVPLSLDNPSRDNSFHRATTRTAEVTWGLKRMNVESVWSRGYKGQNTTVAGADTGYRWEVDGMKNRYRGYDTTSKTVNHNYHWHDAIHEISSLSKDSLNPCGLNITSPCDDNGHGTHTIGTMVGQTPDYFYGVAPDAKWIGCRNMERGNGAPSTYIECFQFFLAPTDLDNAIPRPDLAPHVINNSWYCSVEEGCNPSNFEMMRTVISNLKTAGIVVVVSGGNQGANCSTIAHPAAMFEESFTIGSFAINDTVSGFSAMGPVAIDSSYRLKPNVVAPGSEVFSRTMSGNMEAWSGTSMAGPHAAGLVALLISANPLLAGKVNVIEDIIESTARHADALFSCDTFDKNDRPNNMYGFGKIDAAAAVDKARLFVSNNEIYESNDLILSPNPGNNALIISSKNILGDIIIINSLGQKVFSTKTSFKQLKIHTSHWQSGVYQIIISGNQRKTWMKI